MNERRVNLVRAEALRHRAMALLDEPRRPEHLEVAEALEAAAEYISREDDLCRSETSTPGPLRHGAVKPPQRRRERKRRSRGA